MENNLKYIVYCTTNIQNNKIYIGVHKTNPIQFDGYIGNGVWVSRPSTYEHSKTRFQYAVKKYGVKNFYRKTLAIYDTAEEAYTLEAEIVNEKFLKRNDVYNLALGGVEGGYILTCKKIYQYDIEGNYIQEFNSYSDAAKIVNRSLISIQRALKLKNRCANFYWTTIKYDKLDLTKMNTIKEIETIPVFQYSIDGKFDCYYDSIKEAGRVLNKNSSNIGNAIKLGTICYNKYFSSVYYPTYSGAKNEFINSTEIHQYDIDGNYIQSFPNMQKAKIALSIKSNIYNAIKLNRLCGGFQWSFIKLDKMLKVTNKSGRARKVGKYTLNGELIKVYNSKSLCEKENGRGLAHVLSGRDKTHKGFIYKYLD